MSKMKSIPLYIWLILAVAAIAVIIVISYYNVYFSGGITDSHERWGQLGDFLGGTLNPSFSFLSLIALLITISLQSQELKLTRSELEKSTSALKGQERSLKIQNFDNTFFNLTKMHNEILESLSGNQRNSPHIETGVKLFATLNKVINSDYRSSNHNNLDELTIANATFNSLREDMNFHADHYFRNLYRIVKFIHDSDLEIDKSFYIGILRAQLSSHELAAIFFNGLSAAGKKFKPLIEEYALFDNIRISLIPRRPDLIGLYDRKAYGECDIEGYLNSKITI